MFCLEHAVALSVSGAQVSILDLSNLNPKVFRRQFWRFALGIMQKNRMADIKKSLSKDYGINLVKNSINMRSTHSWPMTKERNEIFQSAMASKYSNLTGRRDTRLDEIEEEVVILERLFFTSTIKLISKLQKQFNFHEIVTVNGRYVVDGAVVQACRELNVKYSLIEASGSIPGLYDVYKVSPHDIPSLQQLHMQMWNESREDRNVIAERGLLKKKMGLDNPGSNFRASFTEEFKNKNPSEFTKLAVFFPSSDREFAIFPEFNWRNSFGGSQSEAFVAFSRIAKTHGYEVIVRVHPVDSKAPKKLQDQFANIEDRIWRKLCESTDAKIIESRSPISSYDLMSKADLCATYASSIAIECILAGKPTLILGEAEISHCVPEICAFNDVDLASLFKVGIPIVSKEALYPYGYWLESAGRHPQFFKFISDEEVYFNEKLVNDLRIWAKPIHALKRRINAFVTEKTTNF
jgi:hypothetical protein